MSMPASTPASTSSPEVPNPQFDSLLRRNQVYASDGFVPDLKMMPAGKTLIIGCVDPRVDPRDIFQLEPGEAAVIRNVSGKPAESLPTRRSYASPSATGRARSAASTAWA
jgi:hypothetical protein